MAPRGARLFALGLGVYFVLQVAGEDVLMYLALAGGDVVPQGFAAGVSPATLTAIGAAFGVLGVGTLLVGTIHALR